MIFSGDLYQFSIAKLDILMQVKLIVKQSQFLPIIVVLDKDN